MRKDRILAVIPARGGSKGLPGKNVRPFLGVPLIAHSIRFAAMCPEITRCVVSTDSPSITRVARRHGGDVPFLRPASLAKDATPMWPVLRHALSVVEGQEGIPYDALLLLDPTSPGRDPSDVRASCRRLRRNLRADGVVAVSRPEFSPIWHCVLERDGFMEDFVKEGARFQRRQDVPTVYRINGALYLWRADFVRRRESWRRDGRHLLHEIPEGRAMSIDTADQFKRAELLVKNGLVHFPWMKR
jgi:CMP-N,N'-diacetyllegionaminic acid synthase